VPTDTSLAAILSLVGTASVSYTGNVHKQEEDHYKVLHLQACTALLLVAAYIEQLDLTTQAHRSLRAAGTATTIKQYRVTSVNCHL
jgi:Ca2+/H+ antiporter